MTIATPLRSGALRRRVTGTAAVAATSLTLVAAALPAPGPLGIGDRLFPTLGNPGYDVRAYDLTFRYSGDHTKALQARTVITARVTARSLDRVNLDYAGGPVRSVRVNGLPSRHTEAGEDLVITPPAGLERGDRMRIVVRHTSPTGNADKNGWVRTRDGLVMANQADAAHRVFPCNDHPSDKARFTFHITAPKKLTVVAGGRLSGTRQHGRTKTWNYSVAHPMATELAQVSIGKSAVLRRVGPHGLPLRHVVPAGDRAALQPWLGRTPQQIAWMEKQVGPFPFDTYGLLIADATTGFELETQTLSLFEEKVFTGGKYPDWYLQSIMVHELSHQWFGDSVSPRRWTDLWIDEGHATWYEWRYAARQGGPSLLKRVHAAYKASDGLRKKYGAPAAPHGRTSDGKIGIFTPIVYDGSAVVLYALRQKIGKQDFRRLERAWVTRHRDGVAATGDFIRLASEVSGRDLSGFLTHWLYDTKTPPMPGHPKWRSR
jgi:aminopeptidase N